MEKCIYIVNKDFLECEYVKSFLIDEGFSVETYTSSNIMINEFYSNPCDLIVLDTNLEGLDVMTVCSILRSISPVPIILLSSSTSDLDKITALNLGCDDCICKPFSYLEFLARIKAIFRRIHLDTTAPLDRNIVFFGDIVINKNLFSVKVKNTDAKLTKNEFDLVLYLIENKDRAVSRHELLRKIWDFKNNPIDSRATDDTIKRLRKKLSTYKSTVSIKTIRGFGFRIIASK